ncbi:alpha/beta hydrolase [Halorhodospira sp. 9621]|uniref:alpha/beta hydrolase n=1 Tax=Halorhodospira TaxID=85108 RepID=UPI0019136A6D|nr:MULTISPECIES: alpha/beta hydrolase [Halorhodospira]MBK5936731.1 alpha/beta hydrolase [Halorhodospira halophila]MCG5529179.1 alpha/beta hydrolase [Halorhodospira halophila]MCG5532067.1 alpha/beta hydrolase [Halorhodospira sp. 9621]MCG5543130.1 alpha/beta hydrolase [Halorhodospira sp. 9628]
MRLLLSLAAAAGLIYVGFGALLFFGQERMVHLPQIPSRELQSAPADRGWDYQDLAIPSTDGVTLHGWRIPADSPRGVVVFFHGNAGNISHRLDTIAILRDLGLDVIIFDYRGYGQSEGSAHEAGLHEDARAVARWVREELGVPSERMVFHGRSLGGALAASAARHTSPAALILESSFTSAEAVARDLYPFYPARWLTRLEYATADYLAETRAPVLIVHSRDDEIIPYHHARSLREAAPGEAQLLTIRGDHNTGFLTSGRAYRDGLRQFLDQHLP